LAVITQVTLKVKPVPESSAFVTCEVASFDQAESLLAALVNSQTTPTAIELLSGPAWRDDSRLGQSAAAGCARLVVGLEGTRPEVDWMVERLASEWQAAGVSAESHRSDVDELWNRLVEFPSGSAPLVLKINVRPSAVTSMMQLLAQIDPQCSIQAHAGNGILVARFSQFSAAQAAKVLIQRIHPAAAATGGSAVVWSCPMADELTRQAMWGIAGADVTVMQAVKKQFDPKGLLNPGRFVYGNS
jgi:glycolate oxidase FAD binding subunit